MEWPGVTAEQYDGAPARSSTGKPDPAENGGDLPRRVHGRGGGFKVVDVWESAEHFHNVRRRAAHAGRRASGRRGRAERDDHAGARRLELEGLAPHPGNPAHTGRGVCRTARLSVRAALARRRRACASITSTRAPVRRCCCLHGEPTWSFLYRHVIPDVVAAGAGRSRRDLPASAAPTSRRTTPGTRTSDTSQR